MRRGHVIFLMTRPGQQIATLFISHLWEADVFVLAGTRGRSVLLTPIQDLSDDRDVAAWYNMMCGPPQTGMIR